MSSKDTTRRRHAGNCALTMTGFDDRDLDDVVRRLTAALATATTEQDAALATARREGAEAMRKRCEKACRTVATMDTLSEVRPALYLEGRRRGAELCAEAIRALPLPGEVSR